MASLIISLSSLFEMPCNSNFSPPVEAQKKLVKGERLKKGQRSKVKGQSWSKVKGKNRRRTTDDRVIGVRLSLLSLLEVTDTSSKVKDER